ncbi:hypothetical protein Tco_0785796, partial [Tanacetum coccineum]
MTSLFAQFGPFKINYNTQKEKWKMSELIAMRIQVEERLKIENPDTAYLTTTKGYKNKKFKSYKGSKWEKGNSEKASSSNGKESSPKCRLCKNLPFPKGVPKVLRMVWISQKSQENSQKRANTDTRIRRVQKEAKDPKPKPEKSSL